MTGFDVGHAVEQDSLLLLLVAPSHLRIQLALTNMNDFLRWADGYSLTGYVVHQDSPL